MLSERIRNLNRKDYTGGGIVYWMSRDQRVRDNWALIRARDLAERHQAVLKVVFGLVPSFLGATWRHYQFMLEGLKKVEDDLDELNIPFKILVGNPDAQVKKFLEEDRSGYLVTDFSPLRIKRKWEDSLAAGLEIPFECVDAHNIVPCWLASGKQEFAAYTFRPKMKRLLPRFLSEFPEIHRQPYREIHSGTDWARVHENLDIDHGVGPVDGIMPGESAARAALREFAAGGLGRYSSRRNDPVEDGLSGMSVYLHYGQISAQRIALQVSYAAEASQADRENYLEELIVRRELSDNYCFYNPDYDNFNGFPEWARKTLDRHRRDLREYRYVRGELEGGRTHDPLWNAAQAQMVERGKMHGFMRMYWAKKILEWTGSPEEAQETAIYLNDRYELDGRDPNGYTGIAWSIGGVHDRAWFERPVFGKIRYMNFSGCQRKFNVKKYIDRFIPKSAPGPE